MIKAVIFDMYETLITHFSCPLYFSEEMARDAGIPTKAFQKLWHASEDARTLGYLTLEDAIKEILIQNHAYSPELVQLISHKRTQTKINCFKTMHPDIISMMQAIKSRGLKVGLISNCFSEEAPVIRQSEIFPLFDAVCLSYEEHLKKPDPAIFMLCLNRLGVTADECIYVGDGGSGELEAARQMGMHPLQAAWYLRDELPQPCKRLAGYIQLESPMDLVQYIDKIGDIQCEK